MPNNRSCPASNLPVLLSLLLLASNLAPAATNVFFTVADTALLEVSPTNNLGGFRGMNAGVTQEYNRTRALFRFDLSTLPTNTVVLAARVQLVVTRQPGVGEPINNASFGLHRMLVPWGEGNKNPTFQAGKGLPASPGEATWNYAFYPTNAWSSPGGTSGVDFSDTESSFQFIYGTDDAFYSFDSTPEMVDDVTDWIRQPQNNFGWMLLCADESTQSTARRFATREAPDNQPFLELEYLVPPAMQVTRTNPPQTQLHFTAWAGQTYDVLYRDSLATGNWLPLITLSASETNYAALVTDTSSVTQRFYRVSSH